VRYDDVNADFANGLLKRPTGAKDRPRPTEPHRPQIHNLYVAFHEILLKSPWKAKAKNRRHLQGRPAVFCDRRQRAINAAKEISSAEMKNSDRSIPFGKVDLPSSIQDECVRHLVLIRQRATTPIWSSSKKEPGIELSVPVPMAAVAHETNVAA